MDNIKSIKNVDAQIDRIRQKLLALGPMHPGSISQQYHACGNKSCQCHHPTSPKKHGPYNKLTYVHRGKSACRFVNAAHVTEMQARLAAYKTFRALMDEWIELSIQRGQLDFFDSPPKKRTKANPEAK